MRFLLILVLALALVFLVPNPVPAQCPCTGAATCQCGPGCPCPAGLQATARYPAPQYQSRVVYYYRQPTYVYPLAYRPVYRPTYMQPRSIHGNWLRYSYPSSVAVRGYSGGCPGGICPVR